MARCGEALRLTRTQFIIRCERVADGSTRIVADAPSDGGAPLSLELDRAHGTFDFVTVWALERADDVLLTVDVGVGE